MSELKYLKKLYMLLCLLLANRSALGNENFCLEPDVLRVCFDASIVNDWLSKDIVLEKENKIKKAIFRR